MAVLFQLKLRTTDGKVAYLPMTIGNGALDAGTLVETVPENGHSANAQVILTRQGTSANAGDTEAQFNQAAGTVEFQSQDPLDDSVLGWILIG